MLVIGGVIGTGLFLGTAGNLHNGGPAGLLISYCIMASLLYSVMVGLGEMIAAFPIAGGHVSLIGRYSSPELSFAVGWLYWYCYIGECLLESNDSLVQMRRWAEGGHVMTLR